MSGRITYRRVTTLLRTGRFVGNWPARADVNPQRIERYQEIPAVWHEARAQWIAKKQEDIQHWEAVLVKHEQVYQEDLKKQKADMGGRLQEALNQTPCGRGGKAQKKDASDRP